MPKEPTRSNSAGPSDRTAALRDRLMGVEAMEQEEMMQQDVNHEHTENRHQISAIESRLLQIEDTVQQLADGTEGAMKTTHANISHLDRAVTKISEDSRRTNELITRLLQNMDSNNKLEKTENIETNLTRPNLKFGEDAHDRSKHYTGLSMNEKIKIWQKNMAMNKVKEPGDSNFVAARKTFERLQRKFPLPSEAEMEMMLLSFDNKLMPTVNRIMFQSSHDETCTSMWNKLSSALYNDSQIQAHNAVFMRLQWNESGESIEEYASKVRSLGENLDVGQAMMKAAFIQGLPKRYQPLVFGDRGSFDSVVAYTGTLVASGLVKRTEGVREVTETKQDNGTPRKAPHRRVCYACGEFGHFARDAICSKYKDRKKETDATSKDAPGVTTQQPADAKKDLGGTPAKKI